MVTETAPKTPRYDRNAEYKTELRGLDNSELFARQAMFENMNSNIASPVMLERATCVRSEVSRRLNDSAMLENFGELKEVI